MSPFPEEALLSSFPFKVSVFFSGSSLAAPLKVSVAAKAEAGKAAAITPAKKSATNFFMVFSLSFFFQVPFQVRANFAAQGQADGLACTGPAAGSICLPRWAACSRAGPARLHQS